MAIPKDGYVALLDILGFSNRVMRGNMHGLDSYIKTVMAAAGQEKRIKTILFSDTVVFYTMDDSDESFDVIVRTTSLALYQLIAADIPLRGAISHGSFVRSVNTGGTVIAGRPIIDAHHYESQSQWIGVMLAPSVLEHRPDISQRACSIAINASGRAKSARFAPVRECISIQPNRRIPLAALTGELTDFEGYAVVPLSSDIADLTDLRTSLIGTINKLTRLMQLAPDARSQAKYQRTRDWLRAIRAEVDKVR